MRIEVGFHSVLHSLFLLNTASFKGSRVIWSYIQGFVLRQRLLDALFNFSCCGVCMLSVLVLLEQCMGVEEDLVEDQDDSVAREDEQLRQREDFVILYDGAI